MKQTARHELTKAEARYQELVYELKLLTLAFPHFKESFDKEDLPIKFLLKRGAARAKAATKTKPKPKAKKR